MKRWSLQGTCVVGGTRPLDASVPFARARVVLRRPEEGGDASEEEYLLVYDYPSIDEAEGNRMTLSEWEELLSGGGAHRLETPFLARYDGTLWLLGPRFSENGEREQVAKRLREDEALIDYWKDPVSDILVCYVNANSARETRALLAENRSAKAWLSVLEQKWDAAVPQAELAVAIDGMTPERVALLALLYDRQGRESRSKGFLRMAQDSRGQKFYEQTTEKFEKFSKDLRPKPKVVNVGPRLAKKEVTQALQFIQRGSQGDPHSTSSREEYKQALDHADRAFELGGDSPETIALLAVVHECLGNKRRAWHYLKMAEIREDAEFYQETVKKHRDFSTLRESVKTSVPQARNVVFFMAGVAVLVLLAVWVLIHWTIPAYSSIQKVVAFPNPSKLVATILVYFMQFGFIAFEAGYVRQNYRRASALKNLIVFGMSFLSYMFFGWIVQRWVNQSHPSALLDICFNAGFASTVALIIANTITERGTLFVNSLLSILAAALAYPLLAGAIFDQGIGARSGFIDTAGGCVVHVLGGAIGFFAAWWIGPRMKRRVWGALGKVQIAEKRDILPFSVIGGFFLWFGWLGFNSGNASDGTEFITAFVNTNIAASAGGLVGLIIAVSNGARLTRTVSDNLISRGWWRDSLRDMANLERVIVGMMGGLVAVTANASHVEPWQALIEATAGAAVAIVGSAVLTHVWERLDDPLGAIATHGGAGMVGVVCSAFFYYSPNQPQKTWYSQFGIQALGLGLTILAAGALASALCAILLGIERGRKGSSLWLYGKLFRLTAYEQFNDSTGTEFWSRDEAIGRALVKVRALPPMLQEKIDKDWMSAVGVLALSDEPDEKLQELFEAINTLLETSKQGRPEEQVAIAAIRARVRVHDLLMCVERALEHRNPGLTHKARQWKDLDPEEYKAYRSYRETLIVTITDLAESFAAGYRIRRFAESLTDLEDMILGFGKGCELLEQIGNGTESGKKLRKRAKRNSRYLKRLPWYSQIIEDYQRISATPRRDDTADSYVPKELLHDTAGTA